LNDSAAASADRDQDLLDHLQLALIAGVGPRLQQVLVTHFGSASEVLQASEAQLRQVPGIGPKLSRSILQQRREVDAAAVLEQCRQHGIDVLTLKSESFPRVLREIHDPPAALFCRGRLIAADALSIAIVGSRHATGYGLAQSERLAGSLARAGLCVVSGLARGIDGAAHRGALQAGGRTIAVLGSGLLNVYPPEHRELADEVIRHGALLSEAPPGAPPLAGAFPQRNRIITGLALGVIVVEASRRSGALISARHAMEQGREVFAVPGRIDSRMSQGCHQLIRDGATLVESAQDVLDQLGPLVESTVTDDGQTVHHPAELQLNDPERQVLACIDAEPVTIDEVIAASGLPPQGVLATISVLEMRHLIRRHAGGLVSRPV